MAKTKKQIVNMIPESETRNSHSYCYSVYKTSRMLSEQQKLRLKNIQPCEKNSRVVCRSKITEAHKMRKEIYMGHGLYKYIEVKLPAYK